MIDHGLTQHQDHGGSFNDPDHLLPLFERDDSHAHYDENGSSDREDCSELVHSVPSLF